MSRLRAMLRPVKAHPVWGALAFASLTLVVLWAFVPQVAQAGSDLENALIQVVGAIIGFFVYILGKILIMFIGILVTVAQFNNFIDAPAVKIGWSVTRDMANMFFIIALLLIAIGTMFRIDQYRYSRTLSKLIVMAILINFSKAIAGFFIDLSQVVMLTFVNAFKDQAAGSLSAGFGIDKLLAISSNVNAAAGEIDTLSVLGSLFAALIMVFIATVIVAIFTILLIQRIIMLWIYIVLAPTAYMVAVLPGSLGSWWSSWWRDFSQYLIKGPVIAFFLWLALTIITLSTGTLIPTSGNSAQDLQGSTFDQNLEKPTFVNEATTGTAIINYLVAIGMLIAGLQQATKAGGAAGAVAGKWMGNFNKWGSAIATSPLKAGGAVLKRPAYGVAGGALGGTAAAFNSKYLAWTGLGATFGKMNARLTKKRQKSEEKDSDWVNYADDKTKQRLATSSFALTEGGRIDQKNARENIIKNNQFRGLTAEQRDKVIAGYRGDIGHDMKREYNPVTKKYDGKYYETSADAPGLKLLTDHLNKKSPASMEADIRNARANGDRLLADYWEDRIKRSLNKMTPHDFNEMNASDWNVADHPVYSAIAAPVMRDRVTRNPTEFPKRMRGDVNADTLQAINDSYTAVTGAAPLFKRGRRVTPGDEEAQRRQQRVEQRETQVHDISGLRKFADGKTNQFGMDTELLKTMSGIDGSETGGFIRDPQQIRDMAGKMQIALQDDVKAIETQLADLKIEEGELQQPSTVLDASGRPVTMAATDPKRAAALQQERTSLERELDVKRRSAARLADPSTMQDLIFYNRDQHPSLGEAKNSIAHENVHKSIQEMDPDGSIRNNLLDNYLTPQDRVAMVEEMQKKTGVPYLSFGEAFNEYVTEGLVNEGRYGDKGPDAVKLKPGLSLVLREKAEEKGVKFKYMAPLPTEAEDKGIVVPAPISTTGATIAAAGRQVKSGLGSAVSATKNVVAAPFRSASARVAASKAIAQGEAQATTQGALADEQRGLDAERAALQRLEANQREQAAQELAEHQSYAQIAKTSKNPLEAKTAAERANTIQAQIKKRADAVLAQRKVVSDGEAQVKQLQSKLQGQPATGPVVVPNQPEMMRKEAFAGVQEGLNRTGAAKANLDETTVARNALQQEISRDEVITKQQRDAMGTTAFKGTAQQLKGRQQSLAQREQALQEKKAKLAEFEGIIAGQTQAYDAEDATLSRAQANQERIDRKGEPLPPPSAPPTATEVTDIRSGTEGRPVQVAARRMAAKTGTRTQGAVPQQGAGQPVFVSSEPSAEPSVVNVTQNITNAFKTAPADVRGKLMAINSEALDSALKNSIVWRGLMSYIRNNTAEVQKSEKLGDLGREELQKRIGKLQGHMDEGNAEAFKNEFGELQSMFSGGGGSESSPEA